MTLTVFAEAFAVVQRLEVVWADVRRAGVEEELLARADDTIEPPAGHSTELVRLALLRLLAGEG